MLLAIESLDFFVRKTQILRSVSLNVQESELVCILGRNGSGKSSILKTVIGLYRPTEGKIVFAGRDITDCSTRERVLTGLAYSPEDARVFPDLTVEENISLGLWITQKQARADVFSLERGFEIFPGLKSFIKRRGSTLSGGEKKMVSIVRALALSPFLLLLDESFEGLAPLVLQHFMEAMRSIRGLGISVLLAESNFRIASLVSERVFVVERGEIIFTGTPDQIQDDERLLRIVGR